MTGSGTVTRAAADIGGTFTDVAVLTPDGRLATRKLPSTPANYADAVIAGVRSLLEDLGSPPGALEELLHGCTVATNAILEGKGAPTALLTTRGFRDVLELRRSAGEEHAPASHDDRALGRGQHVDGLLNCPGLGRWAAPLGRAGGFDSVVLLDLLV